MISLQQLTMCFLQEHGQLFARISYLHDAGPAAFSPAAPPPRVLSRDHQQAQQRPSLVLQFKKETAAVTAIPYIVGGRLCYVAFTKNKVMMYEAGQKNTELSSGR